MNRLAELTQKLFLLGQKENLQPIEKELLRSLTIELYDLLTFNEEPLKPENKVVIDDNETNYSDEKSNDFEVNHPTESFEEEQEITIYPIEEEEIIAHDLATDTIKHETQVIDNQNYKTLENSISVEELPSIYPLETEPEPLPTEIKLAEETEPLELITEKFHLKELDEDNIKEPIPEIPNFLKANTVTPPIFIPIEKVETILPHNEAEPIISDYENKGIVIEHAAENIMEQAIPEIPSPIEMPIVEIKNNITPKAYKSQLGVNDTFILLNELFDNNRKTFDQFFNDLSQYHDKTDAIAFVKKYLSTKTVANEEEIMPIFEDIIQKS